MNRRSPLSTLLVTVAFALMVLEVGARVVIAASDPDEVIWYDASTQLRVEQLDRRGHVELVLAGTSSAWQGLVPQQFVAAGAAESAFNVGLNGGVPPVMAPWLLDQVIPRVDPDTVVWGLTSLDFSSAYGDVNHQAYDDAFETRQGALASFDRGVSDVSELVRRRRLLRDPSMLWGRRQEEVRTDLDEARAILGPDGERLDFTEDVTDSRARIMAARVRDFTIDEADVQRVRDTVGQLLAQGRRVVLVELPLPRRFIDLHPHGDADLAAVAAAIDRLGGELGVPVLRTRHRFADDDFVDFSHFDADAAARFSADIAQQLAAL